MILCLRTDKQPRSQNKHPNRFYENDANILTNLSDFGFSFICNLKYLLSYIVYRIYFDFDGDLCNNFVNL